MRRKRGPTDHEELLMNARNMRSQASVVGSKDYPGEYYCRMVFKMAKDPATDPDVLEIFALKDEGQRRGSQPWTWPDTPWYVDPFFHKYIPIAVINNPSTRLRTLEKMRVCLPKHREKEAALEAVKAELDRRLTTRSGRVLSWLRRLNMYGERDKRALR